MYVTNKTVTLDGGLVVGLSARQVEYRKQNLKSVGKNKYLILKPITMKAGEMIDIDKVPKHIAASFDIPGEKPETDGIPLVDFVGDLEAEIDLLKEAAADDLKQIEELKVAVYGLEAENTELKEALHRVETEKTAETPADKKTKQSGKK
jgi:hypothetical protein